MLRCKKTSTGEEAPSLLSNKNPINYIHIFHDSLKTEPSLHNFLFFLSNFYFQFSISGRELDALAQNTWFHE